MRMPDITEVGYRIQTAKRYRMGRGAGVSLPMYQYPVQAYLPPLSRRSGQGRPEQEVTLPGSDGLVDGIEPEGSGHHFLGIRAGIGKRVGDRQKQRVASSAGVGGTVALKGSLHPT